MHCSIQLALVILVFGAPSMARDLKLDLVPQAQSKWSWAAVSQSVLKKNQGKNISQCAMASRFNHGKPGDYCCSPGHAKSPRCNQGTKIYRALDHYGLLQRHLFSPVSTQTLEEEVQAGFPVPIRIKWHSGSAHYLLVYGVSKDGISVWDPSPRGGSRTLSRRELETYNGGKWVETFLTR